MILVDIEDVRFIGTGQMVISVNHAMQEVSTLIVSFIEGLFVAYIVKELESQKIEMCEMLITSPARGCLLGLV